MHGENMKLVQLAIFRVGNSQQVRTMADLELWHLKVNS